MFSFLTTELQRVLFLNIPFSRCCGISVAVKKKKTEKAFELYTVQLFWVFREIKTNLEKIVEGLFRSQVPFAHESFLWEKDNIIKGCCLLLVSN